MNIINLATLKMGSKVFFIVERANKDAQAYRKAFKVADLKRVSTSEKKQCFKSNVDAMVYFKELN